MADIASLGISVDTRGVGAADQALDRLTKAATDATAAVNRMSAAAAANSNQAGVVARQALSAATAHGALASAVGKSTAAHGAHGAAMMNSRIAMMEYEHVLRAVVDGLSAGMNPLRVFSMEGARLAQAFQMSGGAAGTLSMFSGALSGLRGLMTGWVGLSAGVVGSLGVAGAAILRFQGQQDALARSLNGPGRASGLTLAGLTNIANNAAWRSPDMTQSTATSLAAGYAHAGLPGGIVQGAMDVTKAYSVATGQDLAKAGEDLAKGLGDPAKGAEELSSKLGFLDDRTKQLIDSMQASGNTLGAQRLLLDSVANSAKGAEDRTRGYVSAWERLKALPGAALDTIGSAIDQKFSPSLESQRADLVSRRAAEQNSFSIFRNDSAIKELSAMITRLDAALDADAKRVAASAQRQQDQQLSLQAGAAIRAIDPVIGHSQELADRIALLERTAGNADITYHMSPQDANNAQRSLGMARIEQQNLSPMLRLQQDSTLQIQGIQATTLAQKTMVEARQAELTVLRQSHDAILASSAAEAKRNELLAQAQREIDDATRAADRNLGYAKMTPYQAGRQRIIDEGSDFERMHTLGPGAMLDDPTLRAMAGMTALDNKFSNRATDTIAPDPYRAFGVLEPPTSTPTYRSWSDAAAATARPPSWAPPRAGGAVAPAPAQSTLANAGVGIFSNSFGNPPGGAFGIVGKNLSAYDYERQMTPIRDANAAIDAQNALLKIQASSFGTTSAAMEGLLARQKLLNEYSKENIPVTDEMRKSLDAYQSRVTATTQAQLDYQNVTGLVTQVQDMASSFTSGAASELATSFDTHIPIQSTIAQLSPDDQMKYYTGKLSAQGARNKLAQQQIGDLARQEMFKFGLGTIEKGVMGSGTTPGLLSPLFSGLVGALAGGGAGTGAAGGGGLLGGLLGGIGHLFGFASGGVMTPLGPMPLHRYAAGGVTSSPQAAIFGEGSGSEAYVPLPDGRSIPVAMKTPKFGGGAGMTQHNNYNVTGGDVVVQGNADEKVIPQLRAEMAQSNKDMMAQLQRNIGSMSAKWGMRYGNN